jgi:hypothetical protein
MAALIFFLSSAAILIECMHRKKVFLLFYVYVIFVLWQVLYPKSCFNFVWINRTQINEWMNEYEMLVQKLLGSTHKHNWGSVCMPLNCMLVDLIVKIHNDLKETMMGLHITGFVSLQSVIMTVMYLTDTTHKKNYYRDVGYDSKRWLPCYHTPKQ